MSVVYILKKALHRVFRVVTLRNGIYCTYGKNCVFKEGFFADEGTVIGNYNYFGRYTTITKAKIGNYCSVASFVTIGPGEHDVDGISTSERINRYKNNKKSLTDGEVIIGNDVWIGINVVVLRNVKVGNGAILAAGSIITKDVPPYAIVGGVPAHIIRFRKIQKNEQVLEKLQWWNLPPDEAAKLLRNNRLLEM